MWVVGAAPAVSLDAVRIIVIGVAAVVGGAVNAVAGGGTLITFPALTAVGITPVSANVTNTVALSPGYFGGALAQRADLRGQQRRLWLLVPTGVIGGLAGGVLLLATGEAFFRNLVPFLIFAATLLLAFQERLRRALVARLEGRNGPPGQGQRGLTVPALAASVYGGYFGAGLGIILLATLGISVDDSLTRINALKQATSLAVNVSAAVFFLFSGRVSWVAAAVMAVGSLTGGHLGGRAVTKIRPDVLRRVVVIIGMLVGTAYLVR